MSPGTYTPDSGSDVEFFPVVSVWNISFGKSSARVEGVRPVLGELDSVGRDIDRLRDLWDSRLAGSVVVRDDYDLLHAKPPSQT